MFKPCVFFWSLLALIVVIGSVLMACSPEDQLIGGITIACGIVAFLKGREDEAASPRQRGLDEANRILRYKTSPLRGRKES